MFPQITTLPNGLIEVLRVMSYQGNAMVMVAILAVIIVLGLWEFSSKMATTGYNQNSVISS